MAGNDSIPTAACDVERARREMAASAGGYRVPPMPKGLASLREWLREVTDAYSAGLIDAEKLREYRRSSGSAADLHRVGAELDKAKAALRSAEAQERIAFTLLRLEHGGSSVVMFERLLESVGSGITRPIPGRPGRPRSIIAEQAS